MTDTEKVNDLRLAFLLLHNARTGKSAVDLLPEFLSKCEELLLDEKSVSPDRTNFASLTVGQEFMVNKVGAQTLFRKKNNETAVFSDTCGGEMEISMPPNMPVVIIKRLSEVR